MSYTTLRRFALVFVVSLVCTASSSWAADWRQLAGEFGRAAWAWLDGSAWGHGAVIAKAGCSIDPAGNMNCAPIMTKQGCSIDPDGNTHCAPVATKSGCSVDPLGNPHCPSITPKAGCSIDPQGNPRCQP
ncbi:MAG TPA: hypothetical protein VGS07_09390 [Thermoanaerobaculia bacterium]|nr:hypothetical protein [Thermoanaerobaculia bacterium]